MLDELHDPPTANIMPNSPMDDAKQIAATEFVDELVQLGVLKLARPGHAILAPCAPNFNESCAGMDRTIVCSLWSEPG
jgi:hypothetical protein